MIPYRLPRPLDRLPIIDFSAARSPALDDRRALAARLREVCRDVGFFYLDRHGLPGTLIADQLAWTRRVFALPAAELEKVSVAHSKAMLGFAGIATQALDADTPPDLKESFYVGVHRDPEHPYVQAGLPNHGPNQWPALPGFREHTERYFAALSELSRQVLRILALSLDLDEGWFDPITRDPNSVLRLLHYPPHPQQAKANQLGAGAHTDWGGITLLLQDDAGGLEVRNAAGDWIRADPVPGTLVVNLGDMMQRWTNDLYVSTMHRVLNAASGRDRYSAAFFFNPDYHTPVECLPNCRSAERPPRYPRCTAGEHIAEMYRLSYGRAAAGA